MNKKKLLLIVVLLMSLAAIFPGIASAHPANNLDFDDAYNTSTSYYGVKARLFPNANWTSGDSGGVFSSLEYLASYNSIAGLEVDHGSGYSYSGCASGYFGFKLQGQSKYYCTQHKIGDTINGYVTKWTDTYDIQFSSYSSGSGGMNLWIQDENAGTVNPVYFCKGGSAPTCTTGGGQLTGTPDAGLDLYYSTAPSQQDFKMGMDNIQGQSSGGSFSNISGLTDNATGTYTFANPYNTVNACLTDYSKANC